MLVALGLVVASPSATASPSAGTATITSEADWILSSQLHDGAIAVWPDRPELRLVWPYLANYAAMGLAEATSVTGDGTYADHAWAYLRWYSSVEEPGTGYVTDYTIVNGTTPVSEGHMDSTDAYAGTFLAAAWDTYAATQDLSQLEAIASGIAGAVHAIATTQQPDGLTWALPTYPVAYLMDNAEVYGGLVAAARLEEALGNATAAAADVHRAELSRQGIASLWDPRTGAYDWARQVNGWQHPTSWNTFYPDAMEQVWAAAWDAVPASRGAYLLGRFARAHPNWSDPTSTALFLNGASLKSGTVGYWPMAATAFNQVGGAAKADSSAHTILSAAAAVNYAWPYTTADAGQEIMSLAGATALAPVPSPTGYPFTDGPHHGHAGAAASPSPGSSGPIPVTTASLVVRLFEESPGRSFLTCRMMMPCSKSIWPAGESAATATLLAAVQSGS